MPVVVKPRKGNQGRGVSVALRTREAVLAAYDYARLQEDEILVERHVEGCDFRLLVIGGRLISAARRVPPSVIGDGQHTINELVDIENQEPEARRGSRDLAVQAAPRRDRPRDAGQPRPDRGLHPGRGADGAPAPQRQPQHRRQRHRHHRPGTPAGGRASHRRRRHGRPRRGRHRRHRHPHRPAARRHPRRHRRGQRRARPAHAPRAVRGHAAPGGRGHDQLDVPRTATTAASPSWPSPAPTARPPPPAAWPTCSSARAAASA